MTASEPFWRTARWRRVAGKAAVALWLSTLVGLFGSIIAARTLGTREFGRVAVAEALVAFIVLVLDFSLEDALLVHGSRARERGDGSTIRGLLRFGLIVDLAVGIVVLGAVLFVAEGLTALTADSTSSDLVRIAAVVLATRTVDGVSHVALVLRDRQDLIAGSSLCGNLVRLGAIVAVSVGGATASSVLWAYAAGSFASSSAEGVLAWRGAARWRNAPPAPVKHDDRRAIVRFAVHSSVASSIAVGRDTLPVVIVGRVAGSVAAGITSVALLPITAAEVLAATVRMVAFGEQTRLAAQHDIPTLADSVRLQSGVGLAVGVPLAAVGWAGAPWLVERIYGSDYGDAVTPMRIMLIAAVAVLAIGWWKTLPATLDRPAVRSWITGTELTVLVVLVAVLAERHGATGAAVAITVTTLGIAFVWVVVAARLLPTSQAAALGGGAS